MKKILIVEDDESYSETLTFLLRPHFEVQTTNTLSAASQAIANPKPIHLVLLDLTLPDGSGDDLIKLCGGRGIPVVVLSMSKNLERAVECMARGASYYLTKQSPPDRILDVVSATLSKGGGARDDSLERKVDQLSEEIRGLRTVLQADASEHRTITEGERLKALTQQFEKRILMSALERNKWRRNAAAKELGVHINTLLLKMRKYGLARRKT